MAEPIYTAKEIAQAAGMSARGVRKCMGGIPPDGEKSVSGNNAAAWMLSRLPADLRRRVASVLCATSEAGSGRSGLADLRLVTLGFLDRARPSRPERELFLVRMCEIYEEGLAYSEPAAWKRDLIGYVLREAPWMGVNPTVVRKAFDRALGRWIQGGRRPGALRDLRSDANARRAFVMPKQDRDILTAEAVFNCGGRVSQAFRNLKNSGAFSEVTQGRFIENPSRKSHVPHSIRRQVQAEVCSLRDVHLGPRQAKLKGPHIDRDWSAVAAGDWFSSDDCTLPVYYYIGDGDGGYCLTRGQFLPMIDVRSKRILDFVLIDSKSYDSLSIRTLITKVCSRFFLPRRGFMFERGIWQTSKLLTGGSESAASWSEVELGLREYVEFTHANLPRAKIIEGVLGQLQDLMEGDPGYVGRNEQVEKHERVQSAILDVKSGRKAPWDAGFYSRDQWFSRLHEICEAYNAEPQESKLTNGLSPDQAWETFQDSSDPPIGFPPECRYLLATHRRPIRVKSNGVELRFGNRKFVYRSELTGRLVGQKALAWFDPEFPETITMTDLRRRNPFTVPLAPPIPALATKDQVADANASVSAQNMHRRARYSELKATFMPRLRTAAVDKRTEQLGSEIEAVRNAQRHGAQLEQKARTIGEDVGLPVTVGRTYTGGDVAELESIRDFISKNASTSDPH